MCGCGVVCVWCGRCCDWLRFLLLAPSLSLSLFLHALFFSFSFAPWEESEVPMGAGGVTVHNKAGQGALCLCCVVFSFSFWGGQTGGEVLAGVCNGPPTTSSKPWQPVSPQAQTLPGDQSQATRGGLKAGGFTTTYSCCYYCYSTTATVWPPEGERKHHTT